MQRLYLILIAVVFVLSILFAVLIWRQTIKFEKKALAAKKAREEYLNQLQLEREEEQKVQGEKQLEKIQDEQNAGNQEPAQEHSTSSQTPKA